VPLQARAVPTYWCLGLGLASEGTAVPLQARAVPSFWYWVFLQAMGWHGRATAGTGRAKLLALWGSKNFLLCS